MIRVLLQEIVSGIYSIPPGAEWLQCCRQIRPASASCIGRIHDFNHGRAMG
jgi:hypothetical protein